MNINITLTEPGTKFLVQGKGKIRARVWQDGNKGPGKSNKKAEIKGRKGRNR